MKYPIYTFLLAALVWPASKARIHQTSDAIITEGKPVNYKNMISWNVACFHLAPGRIERGPSVIKTTSQERNTQRAVQ